MELRDIQGTRLVRLKPVSYQFATTSGDPYDDNWLIIDGAARSDTEQWKFREPSLLVVEAKELGDWLKRVAAGTGRSMSSDEDGYLAPSTSHIEPNIGLGLASYGAGIATLRVFLWLESAPPSARANGPDMEWFMDLTVTIENLQQAASDWDAELARFPQRG